MVIETNAKAARTPEGTEFVKAGNDRDAANDVLRGLAILAVILIHSLDWHDNPSQFLRSIYWVLRPSLGYWLPVFLIISGFYIGKTRISSWKDCWQFYQRKLVRILLPWFIWSLVNFFIKLSLNEVQWKDLAPGLIHGSLCYPYYFILVLVKLYLLYPVIYLLVRNRIVRVGLFAVAAVLLICSLWPEVKALMPSGVARYLFARTVNSHWAFFFILGILLRTYGDNIVDWGKAVAGQWSARAILAIAFCALAMQALVSVNPAVAVAIMVLVAANSTAGERIAVRLSLLAALGQVSYTIYLLHEPWLSWTANILPQKSVVQCLLAQLILVTVSICIPLGIRWVVRRICGKKAALIVG